MPGMKVTVPSDAWTVYEDHPGEFNLAAPTGTTANIHFWLDPYPSLKNDKPTQGVGRTPEALISWMKTSPGFIVSAPTSRPIGSGTTATSVDLDLSDNCIDYFVFQGAGYSFPYGTCPGTPVRFYFATLGISAKAHTFVIAIDAKDAKTFAEVLPVAKKIISSVILPATVSAG